MGDDMIFRVVKIREIAILVIFAALIFIPACGHQVSNPTDSLRVVNYGNKPIYVAVLHTPANDGIKCEGWSIKP